MDLVGDRVTERRSASRPAGALLALALLSGLIAAPSCAAVSSHSGDRAGRSARPAVSSEASPDLLAARVLDGLAAADVPALSALVVTKDEFCSLVFPELPSSKVPNVTCDFVWDLADASSTAGLREVLSRHRGERYELVAVTFEKGSVKYPSFTVHKDPVVTIKDGSGQEKRLRLFGDVLEREGRFKLFGFMVD